jgi:nucleolar pre-ribosomal-associated protein 1
LYDPVFLLLDFAHMIVENPPTSALTWVELFRTNVISVIIRALSCNDDNMREVALFQLMALSKRLEVCRPFVSDIEAEIIIDG